MLIDPSTVSEDTPLRLDEAAAIAFPAGNMTASGLRKEASRGRLVVEMIAGKQFTTLAAIKEMRKLCRVEPKAPASNSVPPAKTRTKGSPTKQHGASATEGEISAQDALRAKLTAERAPKDYIASKYQPARKEQDIEKISIADVLSIYLDEILSKLRDRFGVDETTEDTIPAIRKFKNRIGRLNDWWGAKALSDVTGVTCRAYRKHRGGRGGARRDLEDLRAAIGHHAAEGFHRGIVKVKLPDKGEPRERWLTRSEAAALLWACWCAREVQTIHRGPKAGEQVATDKRPLRHLARFILIGLYSGTRAGAIATASPIPAIGRSYVDLDRGVYYRLARGRKATNKRQPPAPIAPRLLAHMRRWHRRGIVARYFVEHNGQGVKSVKTGFKRGVKLSSLSLDMGNVTPHTLRHTAATWLMQRGADPWQAAGYLGMSLETLLRVYGHHHPDHLKDAVEKIAARPAKEQKKAEARTENGADVGAVVQLPQRRST